MASTYTPNLGFTLPTTGELAGTWGDTVNVGITTLIDSAIAGTTTLAADADVTLSTTTGAANQARSAVILWTASNGATTRFVTAPASTKAYIVVNAGTGPVVLRGVGPTTGVTVATGTRALVAWNGTDFVKVSGSTIALASEVTGTLPIANGGTGATTAVTALASLGAQATLVSATNIKTINSNSLLGSGDLAITVDVGAATHAATSKATPVDADEIPLADSAASFGLRKLTWANLKATIVSYFQSVGLNSTTIGATTPAAGSFTTLSASVAVVSPLIRAGTVDGADTGATSIAGGGALSASRGAYVVAYGNENADGGNNGDLQLSSGNASGSSVKIAAGAGNVGVFSSSGLSVAGSVTPEADNTRTLGTGALRWSTVYAGTGTISTSDAREKTEVSALSTAEINAAKQLSKEIGTYKFLASVQAKGDAARTHLGLTVQRAIEIMEANGLEPFSYGFICFDQWDDVFVEHPAIEAVEAVEAVAGVEAAEATFDEEGNELTPAIEAVEAVQGVEAVEGKDAWTEQTRVAGDRYAFRYDQLNLFIAAGIEARLSALEQA